MKGDKNVQIFLWLMFSSVSRLQYRIEKRGQHNAADWFQIEADTGLILTRAKVGRNRVILSEKRNGLFMKCTASLRSCL